MHVLYCVTVLDNQAVANNAGGYRKDKTSVTTHEEGSGNQVSMT